MNLVQETFKAKGMTCRGCENIITKQVLKLDGVKNINVNYATEQVNVEYDSDKTNLSNIKSAIEEKGYDCNTKCAKDCNTCSDDNVTKKYSWISWILIAFGIILISYFGLFIYNKFPLPSISQNMSYALLFLIGLLTGFHCIAMCGGFVVSYSAKGAKEGKKPYQLHASYAIGKTISYTLIGGLFGLLGSFIAFTPTIRGIAGILAGLFLVIFGLKMLNIFPSLRKFNLQTPSFINKWIGNESKIHSQSPLIIGLLNGLMIACGPLQAMYILAAGTGSLFEGAKMLFVFGLGTLPVMLGFGYLTSIISSKATNKILKFSGILVIVLGLIMLNRGLALAGTGYDLGSISDKLVGLGSNNNLSPIANAYPGTEFKDSYQEIKMTVDNSGFTPNRFVLKKGVPVKWIIDGKQLNGCNNAIQVPSLNLSFDVKDGLQTIEFTPKETGTISWSCWMGMLRGVFIVLDDTSNPNLVKETLNKASSSTSNIGSCSAGGCGCGMRYN